MLSCLGAKAQGVEELGVKSGLPTAALLGVLMKRKLKRNNLSVIAARCHLPYGGEALAVRHTGVSRENGGLRLFPEQQRLMRFYI